MFWRFSLRFEAMFMHSARLASRAWGQYWVGPSGLMDGELNPWPMWIAKGHGMPSVVLLA